MLYKSGYRKLLKSAAVAFSGDQFAISSARAQLRLEFIKNKNVTDPQELAKLAQGIDEVDEMLRFNIVQGRKNEKGNFGVRITEEHNATIAAGQHLPLGPELEPIDPSYVGADIVINKAKGDKQPFEEVK